VTTPFDVDTAWQLHPQVSIRPERFGALFYHFGTRRLSFLKSPTLLAFVASLAEQPSARREVDTPLVLSARSSVRRECLDHPLIIGERHPREVSPRARLQRTPGRTKPVTGPHRPQFVRWKTRQLHLAPPPAPRQLVRNSSLSAALRRGGRTCGIPPQSRPTTPPSAKNNSAPQRVEAAMAGHATVLLHALDTAVAIVARLEESLTTAFHRHPDAEIITSCAGLGTVLGARILAEIGDDRTRFTTARGLKAFAGTAPITRASGMKTVLTRPIVRNMGLGQATSLSAPRDLYLASGRPGPSKDRAQPA
jgi:putative mycofactocin binding protein MftB